MTDAEIKLLATVAWKENRRGGIPGMQSIINSITNRLAHHRYPKTIEGVIMQPSQYTSMSVPSDPEYKLDPTKSTGLDLTMWIAAQRIAPEAAAGVLADLTNGATLYYAPQGYQDDQDVHASQRRERAISANVESEGFAVRGGNRESIILHRSVNPKQEDSARAGGFRSSLHLSPSNCSSRSHRIVPANNSCLHVRQYGRTHI